MKTTLVIDESRLRDLWAGPLRFVEITEALNCGHEALRKEAKRLPYIPGVSTRRRAA